MWQIEHHAVSRPDGFSRSVTVALPCLTDISEIPVVYCTDGQVVETLVAEFDQSPLNGVRPMLLGVHSHPTKRAQEYLLDSTELYREHEQFIVYTVRSWARSKWGISTARERSILFGFSNGGAFALATALRNCDCFTAVISLSVPPFGPLPKCSPLGCQRPLIYMAAGNQGPEKSIRKSMSRLRRSLQRENIPAEYYERESGHTLEFWSSELVHAIQWLNSLSDS